MPAPRNSAPQPTAYLTADRESDNAIPSINLGKRYGPRRGDPEAIRSSLDGKICKMDNDISIKVEYAEAGFKKSFPGGGLPLGSITSGLAGRKRRFTGRVRLCGALAVFLLHLISIAAYSSDAPRFNRNLETILRGEIPDNLSVSVQVADLETGRVLMEKNPDHPLIPASTMKVVTSAAALHALNPDFTFLTEALVENASGSSVGNLYLRGYGDPYLVSEELYALTRLIREKGLEEIRGNIIVDDSYFVPDQPLDENEQLGYRSYHAPYGALSLNFNSLKILIHPGDKPGKPARVAIDPISEYAVVKADIKTVKGSKPCQANIIKETTADGQEIIKLEGEVGIHSTTKGRYVNVATPSLYTGEVFKEFLLREGIRVTGRVVRGKVPSNAVLYAEFNSRPLSLIVYWLNKFSNNFMAEQINMALGAKVLGPPGTREKGLSVIRKYLLSCGIAPDCFSLSEASGLSRNNRLSASALVRVLLVAARDFSYNSEFMASLGVSGVDGTLKEKLIDPGAKRRIRGKTGTLRGVNALTGYGMARDGKRFAFAVLVNSKEKGAGFINHADKIVRQIMDVPMNGR